MPASPEPTQRTNAFERMSAPVLLRLHAAPRWLLAVALAAFLVVGLLVEGPIGATLLFVLALFLGWLAAIGWRLLSPGARAVRLLIVALVVAAGVAQLL
jgi:energy-coupling factor transporter transmembrane protein EcfT